MMTYHRKFEFQASHFNGENTYFNYLKSVKDNDFERLHTVLCDQHGHNFKVKIQISAELKNGFIVDDLELEEICMRWQNTNITLHSDFADYLKNELRITLEIMVDKLQKLIMKKFDLGPAQVRVRINETDLIYAEA